MDSRPNKFLKPDLEQDKKRIQTLLEHYQSAQRRHWGIGIPLAIIMGAATFGPGLFIVLWEIDNLPTKTRRISPLQELALAVGQIEKLQYDAANLLIVNEKNYDAIQNILILYLKNRKLIKEELKPKENNKNKFEEIIKGLDNIMMPLYNFLPVLKNQVRVNVLRDATVLTDDPLKIVLSYDGEKEAKEIAAFFESLKTPSDIKDEKPSSPPSPRAKP